MEIISVVALFNYSHIRQKMQNNAKSYVFSEIVNFENKCPRFYILTSWNKTNTLYNEIGAKPMTKTAPIQYST